MALIDFRMAMLALFTSFVAYCVSLLVYRLFFHPLAKFPGPKLAACTLWYEFYYDVVLEGQWVWKIKEMHEQYGPIVRINPHELHIRDAEFYNEIYAPIGGAKKRDKYLWWCGMAGAPGSIFATVSHEQHRQRRAPLNDFFSKKAVSELEPTITSKVRELCDRFAKAAQTKEIVRVDCAFMALTMDVICSYCFGEDRAYLDHPDFGKEWKETINGAWQKGALMRAFPFMADLLAYFPRSLANRLDAEMGRFIYWQDSVKAAVEVIVEHRDDKDGRDHRTIFHTLRDSDLPPEEKTVRRFTDEGQIFTGAGSETTAKTLTTILYYLVTHPECMAEVKRELRIVMPRDDQLASWTQLEQLPYLSAVIQEGLRLSYGITTRLPRVAAEPLQYGQWTIPPITPVSETPYFVLVDPVIFPEPETFRPERWLEAGSRLDKYQVSFNKGSRMCIGINLAYAEMYLACGALFRRFDFELRDTDSKSMEMVHDFFVAFPGKKHRGVQAIVISDTEARSRKDSVL